MRCRKLVVLGASITIAGLLSSAAHAKKIYPAEIVGRDLDYPYLGWLGHVGIATANMSSPSGMNQNATQVIEILKEPVVGQINSISNFKSRSPYWGSKYGVADREVAIMLNVIPSYQKIYQQISNTEKNLSQKRDI